MCSQAFSRAWGDHREPLPPLLIERFELGLGVVGVDRRVVGLRSRATCSRSRRGTYFRLALIKWMTHLWTVVAGKRVERIGAVRAITRLLSRSRKARF